MLQQTQVERVAAAYERFIAQYPTTASLAAAARADVVRSWKGLGYNLRAVRLHELAIAVTANHGGVVPSDERTLRALPGIGAYTAGAVRVFAFGADDVAIDVNVRRVVHRLRFGIEHPWAASAAQLDDAARALLPHGDAHAWSSAMMDLGATVCEARAPRCGECPVRDWCAAARHGEQRIAEAAKRRSLERRKGPQARLPFEQTRRFLRGRILDRLRDVEDGAAVQSVDLVAASFWKPAYSIEEILAGLERDGLILRDERGIRLR